MTKFCMSIEDWLASAVADAERRGLPELRPLLEAFARMLHTLRNAGFDDRADGRDVRPADH
jgi:hypothetical protein